MWCGGGGCHVHEIVPRSRFGHKTMTACYHPRNMCVLCLKCHEKAQSPAARRRLIGIMGARYGYSYDDEPWREYALGSANETAGGD